MEGAKINRSLLALANCINALGDKNKKGFFVPYRVRLLLFRTLNWPDCWRILWVEIAKQWWSSTSVLQAVNSNRLSTHWNMQTELKISRQKLSQTRNLWLYTSVSIKILSMIFIGRLKNLRLDSARTGVLRIDKTMKIKINCPELRVGMAKILLLLMECAPTAEELMKNRT